jgi:hypothetical protein
MCEKHTKAFVERKKPPIFVVVQIILIQGAISLKIK